MFVALKPLLAQSQSLTLVLTESNNAITVTVLPKVKDTSNGMAQPLCLTATAEELDAGFVEAITGFAVTRQSLADQIAIATAELDKSRNKVAAGKTKKGTSAGKDEPDLDDEDEDPLGMSNASPVSDNPSAVPAIANSPAESFNLFG